MTMSSRCAGHQVSPCHLMSMSHSSDETQGCEYEVMAVQIHICLLKTQLSIMSFSCSVFVCLLLLLFQLPISFSIERTS